MFIPRQLYLQKLIDRMHNGLVKIITGVRRCGKSYLLNNIFYDYLVSEGMPQNRIIRFAFDSAEDLFKIGENPITLQKERRGVNPENFTAYIGSEFKDNGKYYLLLDEVQMMDCFEAVLNGYLRKENIDVYATGSNAKFLSSDIITEFAGRGDEIKMYPLSFAEFMQVYPADVYSGWAEYMLYGGIPPVVLRRGDTDKAAILDSLLNEIYLKDITLRNRIRNTSDLEDLLNILASCIGSLTNPQKLANTFHSVKKSQISSNTIRKYISYFEDSFLIAAAQKYDIKGKAYAASPKKYYFSDIGLRNARLNFRQPDPGHSMENIIYNELRIRGYNVDVGAVSTIEKNSDSHSVRKQAEVDFVCNLGSERCYIQSAYSIPDEKKRAQETRPLRLVGDSFKKIIVTGEIIKPFYDDYGILTMSIYDFLLGDFLKTLNRF